MFFQASDWQGRSFMDLKDGDNEDILPMYTKGSSWLKICGCSNILTACLTRLITNHAPIGEYRLRFFPKEPCSCPCKKAEIKMRQHLLFNCNRFKKSWNPKREPILDILTFLELNPGAFSFQDSVTPYKRLGKISDILHLNNENNQLEKRAWPPKDVLLDAQSWT